jgi:hypothetical protein
MGCKVFDAALAGVPLFRPMVESDFWGFAGADDGSEIAYVGMFTLIASAGSAAIIYCDDDGSGYEAQATVANLNAARTLLSAAASAIPALPMEVGSGGEPVTVIRCGEFSRFGFRDL